MAARPARELKKMSNVTGLRCVHCAREFSAAEVDYFCPVCGYADGILDVLYNYEAVKRQMSPAALATNPDYSIWRYRPLLPVDDSTILPHLQVGWTPLYDASRLAAKLGVARCWVKDEGRNPTASFKDRASAMGVVKATGEEGRAHHLRFHGKCGFVACRVCSSRGDAGHHLCACARS